MSEDQALPPERPTDGAADGHVAEDADAAGGAIDEVRTGDEQVDSVIADVAAIGERPLAEHPEAFEGAHERLRRALDRPSGDETAAADDS